jgi:NAD(P)-dependent dehydrogenase (short-subunit alcohol dehydrogenase family)
MAKAAPGLEGFSLTGRTAVVTGASRGIGEALARGLAAAGADVGVCARSEPDLAPTTGAVAALGRRSLAMACDVTDHQQVDRFLDRVRDQLGPVDILVNNAGGPLFQAPVLEVHQRGWERVFDLNLHSVFHLSQACGQEMTSRGSGSIINVASILPTRTWPSIAAYSASKAAVLNLTQSMADAFAPHGVRVNAICPGWVRTDLNAAYLQDPEQAETAIAAVPLGRWAEPEDLVGVVVWLASAASSYVTGAIIPVDGGLSFGQPRQWQAAMRQQATSGTRDRGSTT